jgi:hypothetical protein
MSGRLRALALSAALLVSAVGCGGARAQAPPPADPDPPPFDAVTPPPAAAQPATASTGAADTARPIPTPHARSYPFPVATLPGFEMLPDGGSRVFVEITKRVDVVERRAPRVITYVLKGARVVYRNNENALVTVHFNTPVSSARLLPSGRDLVFTVDLRADTAAAWRMIADNDGSATLQVDFPKGSFLSATDVEAPAPAIERPVGVVPPGPAPVSPSGAPPSRSRWAGGQRGAPGAPGAHVGITVTGAPAAPVGPPGN